VGRCAIMNPLVLTRIPIDTRYWPVGNAAHNPPLAIQCRMAKLPAANGGALTRDQERWAEAAMVERQHGARAPVFVAERIGALALAGDVAGIARWRDIAERRDKLIAAGSVTQ
jgi:hypothetical protein